MSASLLLEREFSLELYSSYLLRIFQKRRICRQFFCFDHRSLPVYSSHSGSGGSFNVVFAGFCLRKEMIPLHLLRRLFTGVFSGLVWSPFLLSPCSIDSRSNPPNHSSPCDYEDRSSLRSTEDDGFPEAVIRLRFGCPWRLLCWSFTDLSPLRRSSDMTPSERNWGSLAWRVFQIRVSNVHVVASVERTRGGKCRLTFSTVFF